MIVLKALRSLGNNSVHHCLTQSSPNRCDREALPFTCVIPRWCSSELWEVPYPFKFNVVETSDPPSLPFILLWGVRGWGKVSWFLPLCYVRSEPSLSFNSLICPTFLIIPLPWNSGPPFSLEFSFLCSLNCFGELISFCPSVTALQFASSLLLSK